MPFRRLSISTLFRCAALCAAGASICGCSSVRQWWNNGFEVGPNYCPPAASTADRWIDSADPRVKNDPPQDCSWWTVFNDPTLDGLVETAYRENLDLKAAGTRILDSRAQRNIAIGNLFPQSQYAAADFAHAQISKNLTLPLPGTVSVFADGLNASWELDFWGRYRRSIEAAEADLDASVQSYGDTLVLLLSEVATNYVQLRTFEQRLQFARENVSIQQRSLGLAEARFRDGRGTELDVRQARSNLSQTQSLIPPLVAGRRQAGNRLCTLLGRPVTDISQELPAAGIPIAPPQVALGIPADLLRRRPDVLRAERQVAAQSARIGVAEADLYPRLALSGFLGYAANDFSDLFASKSFLGFILPNVQWNVLNYGRIRNNVRAQDVRLEGAALAYEQAVLNAGREVEDAVVGFLQAQEQAAYLESSAADARRTVELVLLQFQTGVVDFNRVFNAQSSLVAIEDQLAIARGTIALNLIQIYKALGGGWQCFVEGRGMPGQTSADNAAGHAQPAQEPANNTPAPAPPAERAAGAP